ncbi:alpha-(1,6)-fucosyltransferase [Macrosteles quadrilineatus]|uniref:alpha-(1,6)-fucosyltransferase n=1 Tax=Macrosteles quadrilineatus TaxID=74068 RepID=UPI0023E15C15|nr:alpha-(1,6)-fucosyltransferase [Macrosteles quadrilineatus]
MIKTKVFRQMGWGRALGVLLVVWFIFIIISFGLLKHDNDPQTAQRINQALKELQLLQQQRSEVNQLLEIYINGNPSMKQDEKEALFKSYQDRLARVAHSELENEQPSEFTLGNKEQPSLEYEKLRRRLKSEVEELWYFVSAQVRLAQREGTDSMRLTARLTKLLDEGIEHKRALLKDIASIGELDGYSGWRLKEAADLSDLVQRRLYYLQNPADCNTAKKLVCNLNKGCGYGCQLHHAVYCLLVAYGTQRTMILKSKGWRYHRNGWEEVFKPVSDTCMETTGATSTSNWPGTSSTQVVVLPIIDSISPRPPYLPLAVPQDLAPRIARLHGDPIVWWVGQLLKYLLRPQPNLANFLRTAAERFDFQKPIVGVHIRRTDKVGTEAAFHPVEEYMLAVEEYYQQLSMTKNVDVKRIYLASDDPKVFSEIKKKYPDYEVLGDPAVAKGAAVATRYSDSSLNGIVMDIHFLSLSDHLVCTFSSQVCRVAYEIMQTLYPDAADRFRSLDDIYYFGGQQIHRRKAILDHKSRGLDQMDLNVGEMVGVAGNHWDGYSKGRNLRTNQIGLYPSFKVEDVVEAVEFPTYPQVPIDLQSGT